MIVTIDGPAGSGKSTVARQLAQRLGFEFLDTGAMYRVVGLLWSQGERTDSAAIEVSRNVVIEFHDGRVSASGKDVTDEIRTEAASEAASIVAAIPEVRESMVRLQRLAASGRDIVTEGRDQGTVVFPKAERKFFLVAAPEERARRRFEDLRSKQTDSDPDVTEGDVLRQILERDQRDQNRDVAPLVPAEDAILIDTTQVDVETVITQLIERIQTPSR
ncbi:(d)CMP kinase [Thalassoroseus pseudoceratinae]|uniref:(d)CMP kinase n=1 Tax=Thalassoroseus pseudoceratinae TaxID=2713176 RepID=UPI00141E1B16|nr:(d)CMP kinase [Thalassoroseus pseudoceratinae]